jgi:hypothetical protein
MNEKENYLDCTDPFSGNLNDPGFLHHIHDDHDYNIQQNPDFNNCRYLNAAHDDVLGGCDHQTDYHFYGIKR